MRIGLVVQMHGAPDHTSPAPTWASLAELAQVAERVGFDSFVFEDALLYHSGDTSLGAWESVSMAAALAASTNRIEIGQSVINSPYRSPALVAKIAETLDEISGGRYIFGIGAGNTDDRDYRAFGFPTDHRYSRFAEAIQIIHGLLKEGRVDFQGEFYSAIEAELVLRGPRPGGPPINVAAGAPKMLRLVARYADAWNWWSVDHETALDELGPVVEELEQACEEQGRDPSTLIRTLDLYSVDPLSRAEKEEAPGIGKPLGGSPERIAGKLLDFRALGFDEIRCDIHPKAPEGVEAMAPIVRMVQSA